MEHSYLRYECADAFGLAVATPSSGHGGSAVVSCVDGDGVVWSAAGSRCVGTRPSRDGNPSRPLRRLGHVDDETPVGTGRALNASECACLDAHGHRVATGWDDGAVRVFDARAGEDDGAVASTLLEGREGSDRVPDPPLVLNGHSNSPVTCVSFDRGDRRSPPRRRDDHDDHDHEAGGGARLASGGADGSVVVWDVVAETGLFRLLGHDRTVSALHFFAPSLSSSSSVSRGRLDGLASASLDGRLKVWDLEGQCCVQTVAGHRGEIWTADCGVFEGRRATPRRDDDDDDDGDGEDERRWRMVTGASDNQLRVYAIRPPDRLRTKATAGDDDDDDDNAVVEESAATATTDLVTTAASTSQPDDALFYVGSLARQTNERASLVRLCPAASLMGVAAHQSRNVEIYSVRSVEESEKRRARRLRRRREKEQKKASNDADDGTTSTKKRTKGLLDDDDDNDETKEKEENDAVVVVDPESIRASDEFEFLGHVRASHKVKGFVFTEIHRNKRRLQMVVSLATNALEVHSVRKRVDKDTGVVTLETSRVSTLDQYGHPTGVRCVCLSRADPSRAATVSRGMLKVWSVPSRACLRSLPLLYDQPNSKTSAPVYALCCAFFGDRVAVGTREGHLLVLDVNAGEVVAAEERAHEGAVWALDVRDDGAAAVTGGADGTVVFWNLDDGDDGPTRVRALEVGEDVVALRYGRRSGEKRLVFVATLDCNVRVFFEDSCRLFLNLYGHKLPVLGLDCSDDDAILASGGADKTIKIWGLDFGDVHRTLYGHSDSITDVRFVRRTHNFFSCGRDKTVRYWDGDRFDCVLVLRGHTSEVNSLAVADSGAFVLSAGMDRQIRVWERTKDMVFVSEEKERALEQELDRADGARGETKPSMRVRGEDDDDEEEEKPQSEAAVRRSVLSVAGGDRIMEAIELADKDLKERRQNTAKTTNKASSTAPNPLLLGKDPPQYVLWVLRTIKSAELEQSLLVLPLHHMERLMYYLILILRKGMGVEICAKVAIFLVKTHENQIIAAQRLSTPLRELRRLIKDRLTECRDTIGYNLVAMKTVGRLVREKKNSFLVDEIDYDKNVWGNLGLGSDVAAALEGRDKKRTKR